MGMGQTGLSGDQPMAIFTPEDAARASMGATPGAGATIYPEWAEDDNRMESVFLFARSARSRLAEAMKGIEDPLTSYSQTYNQQGRRPMMAGQRHATR